MGVVEPAHPPVGRQVQGTLAGGEDPIGVRSEVGYPIEVGEDRVEGARGPVHSDGKYPSVVLIGWTERGGRHSLLEGAKDCTSIAA